MRPEGANSPRSAFRVRAAGAGDLDAIDRIEGASFGADRFPRRNLARLLRRNESAAALVLERGRSISGYVLLLFRKGATAARLYSLAVAPEARGGGCAAALVDAAQNEALKRGCARLRLEVRQSNLSARRLYERAGFAVIAEKADYYEDGETALQMEKRLYKRDGRLK